MKRAEQSIEIVGKEQGDAGRPRSDASPVPVQISEDASIPAVNRGSAISADTKDSAFIDAPTEIKENVAAEGETPPVDVLAKPATIPQLKRRKMTEPVVRRLAPLSQTEDDEFAAPKSFIDEMGDLDVEVDALRHRQRLGIEL
ncbi:hypothetical protein [Neorhizobium sp. LjRoot104]|uniref:hypothetical protein n=1 Tax=Neorhizobium sp. LjRoot104 TaxID=3342254 RepID=UPI003ECF1936